MIPPPPEPSKPFRYMASFSKREVMAIVVLYVIALLLCIMIAPTFGRDLSGQYANSSPAIKEWFNHLTSRKGPCCSDADGSALSDTDWETRDRHYRVFIEGKWWDVPDEAVITEPNRVGRTMVWPQYKRWAAPGGGEMNLDIQIRCFIPGSMT